MILKSTKTPISADCRQPEYVWAM